MAKEPCFIILKFDFGCWYMSGKVSVWVCCEHVCIVCFMLVCVCVCVYECVFDCVSVCVCVCVFACFHHFCDCVSEYVSDHDFL